jgi:LPS-assembly protein
MSRHSLVQRVHRAVFLILAYLTTVCPAGEAAEPPIPLYIQADYLERQPDVNLLRFQGNVDIRYGESRVLADVVVLNTETGEGTAEGNVRFEDPQQEVRAERADFNLFSKVGTLYQASGSLKSVSPPQQPGAPQQPVTFYFAADRVLRESEARYRIQQGNLTTCVGPSPVWQFKARDTTVEVEGYAHLSHATFWIKNVPVFYTPYFVYPTKTERATGLLTPRFGTSEKLGFFLENQFFWAINEQSDATIGADYLSKRGIRPSLEYRYILTEADRGQFNALFLDDDLTGQEFWKVSGTSLQTLPGGVRGLLALDLVSRHNYDRTFDVENLFLRTRRTANSMLAFVRNWDNLGVDLQTQRLQDVENLADEKLMRYPDIGLQWLPTPVPWSPLTVGLDAAVTNFRFERVPELGDDLDRRRVVLHPLLAWTYAQRPWLTVTPFFGLHETLLNDSGQDAQLQSVALLGADLRGPQIFKIYGQGNTARYKHLLEPSVTYHWIPSFAEKTRRQPLDIFDDVFPRNDVAISLTNRLYAGTTAEEDRVETREVALLRISQGIDLTGQRGEQFTRIAPGPFFADLALEARAQLTSTLSLRADAAYNHEERHFDVANAGLFLQPLPAWLFSLERRFRRDPNIDFINGTIGLSLLRGWSLTYSTGYNARDNSFAGNSVVALYRSQCWSLSLQMLQRPDETRFALQIGLDSFILPRVGF